MAQRQEDRKSQTRALLIGAAAELFAERGVDAVSVDEIAETAGRTSGAVYSHFGSKQGLVLAVLDGWKHTVLANLSTEVAKAESPRGQLAAMWATVSGGRSTRSDPQDPSGLHTLLEHELWLRAARDPDVADVLVARDADARHHIAPVLSRWAETVGARPVVEPDALAVLITALLAGLAIRHQADPASVEANTVVRGLAALLGLDPPHDQGAGPRPERPVVKTTRSHVRVSLNADSASNPSNGTHNHPNKQRNARGAVR